MIKVWLLLLLIAVFTVVTSTAVHELTHQYKFSEIDQICFLGDDRIGDGINSAGGWVKAKSYINPGETIPLIATVSYGTITMISLIVIFKKEMEAN